MYIIYYDVTSQHSFDAVPKWAELVKNNISRRTNQKIPGVLFANKTDLMERRVVSTDNGRELAEKFDVQYFEGSAVRKCGFKYYLFTRRNVFSMRKPPL